jgi:hypothetical protein
MVKMLASKRTVKSNPPRQSVVTTGPNEPSPHGPVVDEDAMVAPAEETVGLLIIPFNTIYISRPEASGIKVGFDCRLRL